MIRIVLPLLLFSPIPVSNPAWTSATGALGRGEFQHGRPGDSGLPMPPRSNPPVTIPQMIVAAALRHGVPPQLALGRAWDESRMDPHPPPSCCFGLFQLHPASFPGASTMSVAQNVEAGVKHLALRLRQCGGDQACAVWAYRSGRVVRR